MSCIKQLPKLNCTCTLYSSLNNRNHNIHLVVMVTGDPATFMISLCQGLQGYSCPADWVDMLKERDIEKEKTNR